MTPILENVLNHSLRCSINRCNMAITKDSLNAIIYWILYFKCHVIKFSMLIRVIAFLIDFLKQSVSTMSLEHLQKNRKCFFSVTVGWDCFHRLLSVDVCRIWSSGLCLSRVSQHVPALVYVSNGVGVSQRESAA